MMMVSSNKIQNENFEFESFLIEIEALHNILPPHLLLHNDDNADGSGGEGDNDEDLDDDALPHNLCLVLPFTSIVIQILLPLGVRLA